jgi:hypothetical protein
VASLLPARTSIVHHHVTAHPAQLHHLQIALVSEEEFAALDGKLAEEVDPHQRMLNRLNHEVAFR